MPDIVRFEHVTKRYGNQEVVKDLNLAIGTGHFVTLLGPSGCGKSTTLRMLGGFEHPDEGRILLASADVSRLPPNRRDVNMVFQDYALFPHMTISRNVAFGLQYRGIPKATMRARVEALLDLVELPHVAGRYPHELSGGQRQRVALARALAPDPSVLLLDEPLGALDAKLRRQMQVELKALQRRTGKTFLFVTHDQEEAITMSDMVVVMNAARIQQVGTPEEIYNAPANRFVATFLGETNLIEGTVRHAAEGEVLIDCGGIDIRGMVPRGARMQPGDRATVSIRPEEIRCFAERPGHANACPARVTERIFRGNHVDLAVMLDNGVTLNATLAPALHEDLGQERIWLGWDPLRTIVVE